MIYDTDTQAAWHLSRGVCCAVLRLQLSNGTQQTLDGFMVQFNKNAHSIGPVSQVPCLPRSPALLLFILELLGKPLCSLHLLILAVTSSTEGTHQAHIITEQAHTLTLRIRAGESSQS